MVHMLGGFSGLIGSYFVGNAFDFLGRFGLVHIVIGYSEFELFRIFAHTNK